MCATYAPGSTRSGMPWETRRMIAGPLEVSAAQPWPSTLVVNRPFPEEMPLSPVKLVPVFSVPSVQRRLSDST